MKMYKVIVSLAETGALGMCDALEHEGRIWLVPHWLEAPEIATTKPSRIFPLDILKHQKMPANNPYGADYSLADPLPKALFDAEIPQELATLFHVVERPNIEIPGGGGRPQ